MIGTLRQSGHRDHANHRCAFYGQRKCAAVRGELGSGKTVFVSERSSALLQAQTDRVRTPAKILDRARLALHPAGVVRRGAIERDIEQLLPESADFDGDRRAARERHLTQLRAELPCAIRIELREYERLFLLGD